MGIEAIAAIHGSPWVYDTYVPIFFAGHRVPAQTLARARTPPRRPRRHSNVLES